MYYCSENFINWLVAYRTNILGKVFPAGFVPSIPVGFFMMMSIQKDTSEVKIITLFLQ